MFARRQLGSISGVRLRDIKAVSENGILIAGSPGSLIRNITFQVQLPRVYLCIPDL